MKIFILEDDKERIKDFFSMFDKHIVVASNNSDMAISILEKEKFDIIFLDHDLEGKQMVSSEGNTGFRVASNLAKTKNFNTDVVLHSYNEKGVGNMKKILSSNSNFSGRIAVLPFGTFDTNIIYNMGNNDGSENKVTILSK